MNDATRAERDLVMALGRLASEYVEGQALPTPRLELLGDAARAAFAVLEAAREPEPPEEGATDWQAVAMDELARRRALGAQLERAEAEVRAFPKLWECPTCGFTMDAAHEDDKPGGGYTCPACEVIALTAEVRALRELPENEVAVDVAIVKFVGHGIISPALRDSMRVALRAALAAVPAKEAT